MDALVGARTYSLLRDRSVLLHQNEFKSGEHLTYQRYSDKKAPSQPSFTTLLRQVSVLYSVVTRSSF